jgi:hypothetical protein
MFIIPLHSLEGVEIIIKALEERAAEKGCVASGDLALGVAKKLHFLDEKGKLVPCAFEKFEEPVDPEPKKPNHLKLVN